MDMAEKLITKNRKAWFDYEIVETLEAGLVLLGPEVKSLREGRANLKDGYVEFKKRAAYLRSIHISPYSHAGYVVCEAERPRKLLMHSRELNRWRGKVQEKGFTVVPLRLYFKNGLAKCEIALVRGKKLHDKREALKRKAMDREARAAVKSRNWG